MFGWRLDTYCGSARQTNFFGVRLTDVLNLIDEHHSADAKLRAGVEAVMRDAVPRLLGNGHLGGRRSIMPVLVHDDLWTGNRVRGTIASWGAGIEEVVFDPSACWAQSEYELGIMRMFGGFFGGFFDDHKRLVRKTEPVGEYEAQRTD